MSSFEVLHDVSAFDSSLSLFDGLGVFLLTGLLEIQVSLLLPFLVNALSFFVFLHLFGDLLSRLVSLFGDNFTFSVDFLEDVPLLLGVPLHGCFTFEIFGGIFVGNQVHGDVFQEVLLMLTPK